MYHKANIFTAHASDSSSVSVLHISCGGLMVIVQDSLIGQSLVQALGLISRRSQKVFTPEKCSKISNLKTTELFYKHILNVNRGSLHTRSFRRIQLSVFKYWLTKSSFVGLKRFQGF